jgi:opacity protein-like surface antigen
MSSKNEGVTMKRVMSGLAAFVILTSLSYGQFSLRLTGGMVRIAGGDYNKGMDGRNDFARDNYFNISGTYEGLTFGMNFKGEIVFNFNDRMGIGLGSGFVQVSRDSHISYGYSPTESAENDQFTPNVRVVPITLNFHYKVPLLAKLNLDLSVGAGYYLTKMDFEMINSGPTWRDTYTFHSTKGLMGFQGGVGLEYTLSNQLALVLEAGGQYAKLSEVKGDFVYDGLFHDEGPDAILWYYDYDYRTATFRKIYPWIDLRTYDPTDPAHTNVRKGELDLSGFSALAGIKISF